MIFKTLSGRLLEIPNHNSAAYMSKYSHTGSHVLIHQVEKCVFQIVSPDATKFSATCKNIPNQPMSCSALTVSAAWLTDPVLPRRQNRR